MADQASDLVQGTLDMLILKTWAPRTDAWVWHCCSDRTDEQGRFPP